MCIYTACICRLYLPFLRSFVSVVCVCRLYLSFLFILSICLVSVVVERRGEERRGEDRRGEERRGEERRGEEDGERVV